MKSFSSLSKNKGFSLLELLVAIGVFIIMVGGVAIFAIDSFRGVRNVQNKIRASMYSQEIMNGVSIIKNDSWSTIINNTEGGEKHLVFSNNQYSIADGSHEKDGITLSFTIEQAYRDNSGNIVDMSSPGAILDPHTRLVRTAATWLDMGGQSKSTQSVFYINDWKTKRWTQTTAAEFNAGAHDNTVVTNTSGGEITLGTIVYADWCNPSLTLTSYDIAGNGIAASITSTTGKIYTGTGSNASGLSFVNLDVTSNNPPQVTTVSTFDGYKTNNIFGEPSFIYLTTDTNDREVVIINIQSTPNTEVGRFDSPGSTDGAAITVSGTKGYMTAGNSFYVFDLTSKTGSRPQIGNTFTLAAAATKIMVHGDYAFVALNSSTKQVQVLNISNPSSISEVAYVQTTAASNGVDLVINSTADRIYLAAASSSTKDEVFIINATSKSGNLPIIDSADTGGMDPTGIAVVPNRVVVVGKNGTQQYQVFDTTNEADISKCGGLTNSAGFNDIATIENFNGNSYSYVVTPESSSELKIIQGGPGGGIGNGFGYPPTGNYISTVFDTTSASTQYTLLQWQRQEPAGSTLKFQLRTGNSSDLSSQTWVGPDGTVSSFFTNPNGEGMPKILQSKRYVQYRAYFTSDTAHNSIFEEMTLNYEN